MCKIIVFITLLLSANSFPVDQIDLPTFTARTYPPNRGNIRFKTVENAQTKRQTPFYIQQQYEAPAAAKVAPVIVAGGRQFDEEHAPPRYQFHYKVEDEHSGDFKYHTEVRDGDVVRGEYSFKEADGTIRTVKYTVESKSGFNAVIIKSGQANHSQVQVDDALRGPNTDGQDYYRRSR